MIFAGVMLISFCRISFCSLSLFFLNKYAPKLDNSNVFLLFSKNISFKRNATLVFPFTPVISIVLISWLIVSSFQRDKTSSVAWWWFIISYWFNMLSSSESIKSSISINNSSMFKDEWIGLIIKSFSSVFSSILFMEFNFSWFWNESKSFMIFIS